MPTLDDAYSTPRLSFFDGTKPAVLAEEEVSWEELKRLLSHPIHTPCTVPCADPHCSHKSKTTGWAPVTFSNKHRQKSTAQMVSYLVFDIDDVPAEALASIIAAIEKDGFSYILSSTHSHTPPNCRMRLIFDLARPATPGQFRVLQDAVAEGYSIPLDEKTKDVCRFYYLPTLGTLTPAEMEKLSTTLEDFESPFVFRARDGLSLPLPDVEEEAPLIIPQQHIDVSPPTDKEIKKQIKQINKIIEKEMEELKRIPEKFRKQHEQIAAEHLELLSLIKEGEPLGIVDTPSHRDTKQIAAIRELARLSVTYGCPLKEKAVIAWGATTASRMGTDREDSFINKWEEKVNRLFQKYVGEFSVTFEQAKLEQALATGTEDDDPLPTRDELPNNVVPLHAPTSPAHSLIASLANQKTYSQEQIDDWAKELGCMAWELRERKIIATAEALWAFENGEYVGPFPMCREHVVVSWLQKVLAKWDDIEWQVLNPRTLRLQRITLETLLAPMTAHAKIAQKVIYDYRIQSAKWNEEEGVIIFNSAPKRKLAPEYNEQIEEWLNVLVSEDNREQFLDYLTALTWQNVPCAALVLVGAKSVGKQLLGTGIAQLWKAGRAVPIVEAASRFNIRLKDCPFVWADESLPEEVSSQQFRAMLGNGYHNVEQKRGAVCVVEGFLRGLITVNNEAALSLQDAAKSSEDVEAVAQRFLRMDVQVAAERYLNSLNNYQTTGAWTNPENPLLARHLLWIQDQRGEDLLKRRGGKRFIVEGTAGGLLQHITGTGLGAIIAEEILEKLNIIKRHEEKKPQKLGERPFWKEIAILGGHIYVSLAAAKAWLRNRKHADNPGDLSSAMRALSDGQERIRRGHLGRPRYFKMNTLALLANADTLSTDADKAEFLQWLSERGLDKD